LVDFYFEAPLKLIVDKFHKESQQIPQIPRKSNVLRENIEKILYLAAPLGPLHGTQVLVSSSVFFNLGSAEPTGSANYLQGSVRILKLALFLVSRFRQKFNNVSKVPRHEKG